MWSAKFLPHLNHVSVSPTDENGQNAAGIIRMWLELKFWNENFPLHLEF